MKAVFLDANTITIGDTDLTGFKEITEFTFYPETRDREIVARSANAEILIINKVKITEETLLQLKHLKLICVIATGYNNVDTNAARKRGIKVCNVAGYAKHTVPQHTFALILALATRICSYHNDVIKGQWQKSSLFTLINYPTFELAGKCIGIIGFGTIGKGVANIAKSFNMKVIIFDVIKIKESEYQQVKLDKLLRESDIVTIHCPLSDKTKNLIDAEAIANMKSSALLINTARGGIVDEGALADALEKGRLAGAGFDVLTEEPPKNGNPLIGAKNIILTPHSAWSTIEARQRLIDETVENIKAFIEGRPRNVIIN